MARNTKRTPIGRLAALIIVTGSAFLVGLGVAKMVNDEPIEKDGGAHVAKWDIEVDPTGGNSVNLSAGSDAQLYGLTVTNNSDIAGNYTIRVIGVPSGVKIGLDIQTRTCRSLLMARCLLLILVAFLGLAVAIIVARML